MRRAIWSLVSRIGTCHRDSGHAMAQSADPWLGTWTLTSQNRNTNPHRSPRRVRRRNKTSAGDAITVVTDGVDAKGKPMHTDITYRFDGRIRIQGRTGSQVNARNENQRQYYSFVQQSRRPDQTTSRVTVAGDGKKHRARS